MWSYGSHLLSQCKRRHRREKETFWAKLCLHCLHTEVSLYVSSGGFKTTIPLLCVQSSVFPVASCLAVWVRQVCGVFSKVSREDSNPPAESHLTLYKHPRNYFLIRNQFWDKLLLIKVLFFFFFLHCINSHFLELRQRKKQDLGPRTYITINKHSEFFATECVQDLSVVQILGGHLIFNYVV